MSVLELSRRSGVARNTIAALERGEGNPTVDTLYALADALGVPLAALLEAPPAVGAVVRAGEGVHVDGAALDADLLDRFERPGRLRRALRDPLPRGRGARGAAAPVRRRGAAAHARRPVRVGPVDAPVELGPGDYASLLRRRCRTSTRPRREASGTLLMLTREVVAMKRACADGRRRRLRDRSGRRGGARRRRAAAREPRHRPAGCRPRRSRSRARRWRTRSRTRGCRSPATSGCGRRSPTTSPRATGGATTRSARSS